MKDKKFIKLTPFKMQVLQSFPFIDEDFDAITNYELLCKVVEYLNKTVENVDLLNEKVEEFQTYFDNLDVQEEINNKLDEMTESGELADIIAQYLGLAGVLAFNTVNDMKQATNLVNGSIAKTLGFTSYNDGGGAEYKIRTITNEDIVDEKFLITLYNDTLVAELIIKEPFNILQVGAKRDNETDNSSIISAILTKNINTLLFPNGEYVINSSLTIPRNYIMFIGDMSTINYTGSDYMLNGSSQRNKFVFKDFIVNGLSTNGFINGSFTDLIIDNCRLYTFNTCIRLQNSWDISINNTRIQNTIKPMNLGSQANNITFNSCYIVSFTDSIDLSNAEGINFIGCDIANCTGNNAINIYQSSINLIGGYYENISNVFLKGGANESTPSIMNIIGGHSTDLLLKIKPTGGCLKFTNLQVGKISIIPESTSSDKSAGGSALNDLEMPTNYKQNMFNAVTYFDGVQNVTYDYYSKTHTSVIANGINKITIPNNDGNSGLKINDLIEGKNYLLILEGKFEDNLDVTDTIVLQQDTGYSKSYSLSSRNNLLIIPILMFGTKLRINWATKDTFDISKLILQEI